MALVHEMRAAQATASDSADSNPPDVLLLSMARQNFSAILNAIQRVEEYWAGASTVSQLLEQSESQSTSISLVHPNFNPTFVLITV
jgi:hypothetical protein